MLACSVCSSASSTPTRRARLCSCAISCRTVSAWVATKTRMAKLAKAWPFGWDRTRLFYVALGTGQVKADKLMLMILIIRKLRCYGPRTSYRLNALSPARILHHLPMVCWEQIGTRRPTSYPSHSTHAALTPPAASPQVHPKPHKPTRPLASP